MLQQLNNRFACLARRLLPAGICRRMIQREDGAAAVEFALVAAPFIALLFAIIETSLIFFAGQTLETATADASRMIMTGQAQANGYSMSDFKTAVCSHIFALFDCINKVQIDVRTYGTSGFASANPTSPINAQGNLDNSNFTFQPGGPGCIVVARVMYQWPVYVSLLGFNLSNLSGGNQRLLMATAAFRNEPYGTATSCS